MIIPIDQLDEQTLCNIIESFVLREGTDYGDVEVSLQDKVVEVKQQLHRGDVLLVYSELHESVDIVPKNKFQPE